MCICYSQFKTGEEGSITAIQNINTEYVWNKTVKIILNKLDNNICA